MDAEHLRERCRTFLEIMKAAVHIHRINKNVTLSEAFELAKKDKDRSDAKG